MVIFLTFLVSSIPSFLEIINSNMTLFLFFFKLFPNVFSFQPCVCNRIWLSESLSLLGALFFLCPHPDSRLNFRCSDLRLARIDSIQCFIQQTMSVQHRVVGAAISLSLIGKNSKQFETWDKEENVTVLRIGRPNIKIITSFN